MTLRQWAAEAVQDLLGPHAQVVDWLVDHHERCVGKVRRPNGRWAVVKADVEARRTARERTILLAARDVSVAVPAVLGHRIGSPAALVLDWVDGAWLSPERSEKAWIETGAQLRRLHGLVVETVGFHAEASDWCSAMAEWLDDQWDTAQRLGLDDVVEQVDAAMVGLLRDAEPPIGTLHGDCMPVHVRLDADDHVVGLLDFGDTMRGDVAWDLTVLTLRSPKRLDAVLAGYHADPPLRHWVESALPIYQALRHLTEGVWLADHGYNPAASIRSTRSAVERLRH